jgi:hypothetical protein
MRVSGRRSATRYYFKVRVVRAKGTVVTSYTTPVTGKSSLAPAVWSRPVNVRVGSFNVLTRARRSINGWINSLNRFNRDISTYSYENNHAKTGNNIDWIFATNSLPVKAWKMVTDYDPTTLKVRGTIPSDHNMVRATITLP